MALCLARLSSVKGEQKPSRCGTRRGSGRSGRTGDDGSELRLGVERARSMAQKRLKKDSLKEFIT